MKKLCLVLLVAVFLLVLMWFLSLSLGGCGLAPSSSVVQPGIIQDGSLYHPYRVDASTPGTPTDHWHVLTEQGERSWVLSWIYGSGNMVQLSPGAYILHTTAEYQIAGIDLVHHRLSVVLLGN